MFSCANAKKWEIELATLKSNNIRLTSALQESTANVDEWKRQLHQYKEENLRLKRDMDTMKPGGGGGGNVQTGSAAIDEELRKENVMLKIQIQTLEKELMNAQIELKVANQNLKERASDQSVRFYLLFFFGYCCCYNYLFVFLQFQINQLCELNNDYSKHLSEMCTVQKEMEKLLLHCKST